jgi:hypothetical protein
MKADMLHEHTTLSDFTLFNHCGSPCPAMFPLFLKARVANENHYCVFSSAPEAMAARQAVISMLLPNMVYTGRLSQGTVTGAARAIGQGSGLARSLSSSALTVPAQEAGP